MLIQSTQAAYSDVFNTGASLFQGIGIEGIQRYLHFRVLE